MIFSGIIASSGGLATSFESIATVTVGAGGSASVSFSSIPQTYQHLQIRSLAQQASTGGYVSISFNTGTFSYRHYLIGNGSTATAGGDTTNAPGIFSTAYSNNANMFAGTVFDILDYTNTNKNVVTRSLGGADGNGSGSIYFMSGLWSGGTAISSITLTAVTQNFTQYSSFALYGVKA